MAFFTSDDTNPTTTKDEQRTDQETPQAPQHPLDALLRNEPITPPRVGEIVEGPIVARGTAEIFVDLGARGTGIIFGREFFLAQDIFRKKNIGDVISAKVVEPENREGYVELSVTQAGREIAWEDLRRAYEQKETIEVTVDAANRGGLVATLHNIKAFLPVSQLAPEHYPHVEGGDKERIFDALRKFIGQKLKVKIINLDSTQDKLILSERAVIDEELREELKNFHIGDTVDATISGVVDFGLFLRFGPDEKLEGLAHISELAWEKIDNIRERFSVGERVKAKIVDIQGDRVALSLKALTPAPPSRAEAAPPLANAMADESDSHPSSRPDAPSEGQSEASGEAKEQEDVEGKSEKEEEPATSEKG